MARSDGKNGPDENQYGLDFESAYRERMARLRAQLGRVDPAAIGLSTHRWGQVRELLLAICCYTVSGDRCSRSPSELQSVGGLTRDQFYRARKAAIERGLLMRRDRFDGGRRSHDWLILVTDRIAQLADCDQVREPATTCDYLRLPATTCDAIRNPLNPKILQSNTLSPSHGRSTAATSGHGLRRASDENERDWEGVVDFLREDCGVAAYEECVRHVRAAGGTPDDALAVVCAFLDRRERWQERYRPHVCYRRLKAWRSGQSPEEGWPPADDPDWLKRQDAERRRGEREAAIAESARRRAERAKQPAEAFDVLGYFRECQAKQEAT